VTAGRRRSRAAPASTTWSRPAKPLRLLVQLPQGQREDLALLVAGFSYREIAEMTGRRTYTNVNKHLVRARAHIRLLERQTAQGASAPRLASS
jgi:DNA-directed RNA polymerase specialized sigma24 family protein